MTRFTRRSYFLFEVFLTLSILSMTPVGAKETPVKSKHSYALGSEKDLTHRLTRLRPVSLSADLSTLSELDKKVLEKIIEASRYLDGLYLTQVWQGNAALKASLAADSSPAGKNLFHFFNQNVGPWSRLDEGKAFLTGVPAHQPKGAGFYPEDMTTAEFETWAAKLSAKEKAKAQGFFWLVTRNEKKELQLVPYSKAYESALVPAAKLLKEAADLTEDKTLKKYLKTRADAFLSDDYYDSDVAWMDLNSKIEPTIGPYETYEDGLFNYKAAFEAFVTIRNEAETQKLEKFSAELQDVENHLPLEEKYRNPKLGAMAPIRVVDQVFASGEARRGVMTAAFNLPNDEKVVKEKGSKRVMIKNVQEAKFASVLLPISKVVLPKAQQREVEFAPFFTHILMHELVHGLGPHQIKVDGKDTTVRGQHKELYSAIEEAKADITGLFALQYLMDKGVIDKSMEKTMYTTFLASCFRSVRFGIDEAHGKGIALQFNYLTDKGGFVLNKDGTFSVNFAAIKDAVRSLSSEILTLQALGSYSQAKALLEKYAVIRPPMKKLLDKLSGVPIDIEPRYPLAGE